MWTKLVLLGILAIGLLPDAAQSQGFCGLCTPFCTVNLGDEDRRLSFFNNSLYYLDTLTTTVEEANTTCTSLFSAPAWPGRTGNLATIQSTQELNFVKGSGSEVTMDSLVCKIPCSDGIMNRPAVPGTGSGTNIYNIHFSNSNNVEISFDNSEHSNGSEENIDLPDNLECTDEVYSTLNEASRSILIGQELGEYADLATADDKSPSWAGPGWYRIQEPAGTKIPDTPTPVTRCGTYSTGWMDGELPKKVGQTNDVKFCFSWESKNCRYSTFGKVTNCGRFVVYKLPSIPNGARLRYCAE